MSSRLLFSIKKWRENAEEEGPTWLNSLESLSIRCRLELPSICTMVDSLFRRIILSMTTTTNSLTARVLWARNLWSIPQRNWLLCSHVPSEFWTLLGKLCLTPTTPGISVPTQKETLEAAVTSPESSHGTRSKYQRPKVSPTFFLQQLSRSR